MISKSKAMMKCLKTAFFLIATRGITWQVRWTGQKVFRSYRSLWDNSPQPWLVWKLSWWFYDLNYSFQVIMNNTLSPFLKILVIVSCRKEAYPGYRLMTCQNTLCVVWQSQNSHTGGAACVYVRGAVFAQTCLLSDEREQVLNMEEPLKLKHRS